MRACSSGSRTQGPARPTPKAIASRRRITPNCSLTQALDNTSRSACSGKALPSSKSLPKAQRAGRRAAAVAQIIEGNEGGEVGASAGRVPHPRGSEIRGIDRARREHAIAAGAGAHRTHSARWPCVPRIEQGRRVAAAAMARARRRPPESGHSYQADLLTRLSRLLSRMIKPLLTV